MNVVGNSQHLITQTITSTKLNTSTMKNVHFLHRFDAMILSMPFFGYSLQFWCICWGNGILTAFSACSVRMVCNFCIEFFNCFEINWNCVYERKTSIKCGKIDVCSHRCQLEWKCLTHDKWCRFFIEFVCAFNKLNEWNRSCRANECLP